MKALINKALDTIWEEMCAPNLKFRTPDNREGSPFTTVNFDNDSVWIKTGNENRPPWIIKKKAFFEALRYLDAFQHGPDNQCEIASNTNPELAGPLDLATRKANTEDGRPGPRVITYIAPMLAATGLVALDGQRPNKVWLA